MGNFCGYQSRAKVAEANKSSDQAEVTLLTQFNIIGMFARKRLKERNSW
ncbi:hypothetical protein H4F26_20055 [Vibrio alginolyticus]|nr:MULTISPECIES: hypothetical protein [unclassified Vibrio]EJU9973070.1 hypothetical protein [Vibrio alginolyticus]EKA2634710.1 hypothetical protein [Vibrio alginolyticus]MDW1741076.1 hypothetical protein [Vibrio sp. Vb2321]MDW1760052.1 hypothetical protein [Vibrio sp. Vb2353]MDW1774839.1 hypothetical protein [Vibrio sp. Vb2354]